MHIVSGRSKVERWPFWRVTTETTLLPSELNFRANIYGFKKLGVEWILSASAVGSLKEETAPTRHRPTGPVFRSDQEPHLDIFWRRIVAHVSFAEPLCHLLGDVIQAAGRMSISR
jgi:5'-methylthioadenosine phosphorylase